MGKTADLRQGEHSWNKIVREPNSKMMRSKTNSYRGFNGQYTDLVIPSHNGQKPGSIMSGKENAGFGKANGKKEESWRSGGEEETVKEEEAIYSTIRTRFNVKLNWLYSLVAFTPDATFQSRIKWTF